MKRRTVLIALAVTALVIALSPINPATSATFVNAYTVDWYSIDGGGTMTASGGGYSLSGTLGQPDAGRMLGSSYALVGGFWNPLWEAAINTFLPFIRR